MTLWPLWSPRRKRPAGCANPARSAAFYPPGTVGRSMNRLQLEHLIRAAGDIAGDDEIVILGSTAVLSQFPDVPEQIIHSVEADIFPKNKPEMATVIDGCIGELSPFHQTYGYYAHGVGPETARNLPTGWDQRLIPFSRWESALICPRVSHLNPRTLGPLSP
jgi:hypothetical protein